LATPSLDFTSIHIFSEEQMDHGNRGEAALTAGKPEEAIKHYSEAIRASPSAFTYYLKRSIAFQRISKYTDALSDAEIATILAIKRAKRELIGQAQLRRAIALFYMERYGDAGFALGLAKKADDKEKTVGIWEAKLKTKMQSLSEEDERRNVTVTEKPEVEVPDVSKPTKTTSLARDTKTSSDTKTNTDPPQAQSYTSTAQTPANKIRHDWYQNNDSVIISLMAKGVPKDTTTVDIQENAVSPEYVVSVNHSS